MAARRNGKNRSSARLRSFGPLLNQRPNQGLLTYNSWQAQVFIEMLGTMLTEQEFSDVVLQPIMETYARFVREELYAKFVLDISLTGDGLQNSKTLIDIDWNCTGEAFSSTPYRKIRLNESSWGNTCSALLPCD